MPELTSPRAAYTAGLRALADILDEHPEAPAPVDGRLAAMTLYVTGEDEVVAAAHAIGGEWEPGWSNGTHGALFHLKGHVEGLLVQISTYLDAPLSCENASKLAGAAA